MRRQVLLGKGQRFTGVAAAYQLNEALLLQVEEQRMLLLQDLNECRLQRELAQLGTSHPSTHNAVAWVQAPD
jgi:hypothetical protein